MTPAAGSSDPTKPPPADPASAPAAKPLREDLRKDLAKLFVLALPGFLVSQLLGALGTPFAGRPWLVVAILAPLIVGCWIAWELLKGRKDLVLKGTFLWFFLSYLFIFWIAAGSGIFNWRRQLIGYEEQVPPNWLALDRFGDWRYSLGQRPRKPPDLLVVLMPDPKGKTLEELRYDLAVFLRRAVEFKATGVGLDFIFDLESQVDPLLCRSIDEAWRRNVPVFVGYQHRYLDDQVLPPSVPKSLAPCLLPDRRGHLAAYLEWDGRVRSMPLVLGQNERYPSLAYRIADQLERDDLAVPEGRLIQFVEPAGSMPVVRSEDLSRDPEAWEIVEGRFLLVGRDTPKDRYDTPFGQRAGVFLHANTVQALRTGRWIRRLPMAWNAPAIFAFCYLLTALFAFDLPAKRLLAVAVALSLATVGLAAVAMKLWLVWLDVSYPLVAVWLLLGLLLLLRWKRPAKRQDRG